MSRGPPHVGVCSKTLRNAETLHELKREMFPTDCGSNRDSPGLWWLVGSLPGYVIYNRVILFMLGHDHEAQFCGPLRGCSEWCNRIAHSGSIWVESQHVSSMSTLPLTIRPLTRLPDQLLHGLSAFTWATLRTAA